MPLVLDPYLYQILPKSLIETAIYLVLIAALAWPLSDLIYQHFNHIGRPVDADDGSAKSTFSIEVGHKED